MKAYTSLIRRQTSREFWKRRQAVTDCFCDRFPVWWPSVAACQLRLATKPSALLVLAAHAAPARTKLAPMLEFEKVSAQLK